jgi:hypothetical protein
MRERLSHGGAAINTHRVTFDEPLDGHVFLSKH